MKKFITLILSLVLVLSFTACGSSSSSTSKSKKLVKLKVGYVASGGSIITYIAQEKSLFKKEGLDVELIQFTSTSDGLHALSSGKIDVGVSFGTCGPLTFISQNVDFVIIGGQMAGGHPIVTKPENASKFKTIEDYKGKTVATARLYTPDVIWRGALIKAGIDPNKDVKIIEMENTNAVLEAVKAGKVEAGVVATGNVVAAKQAGLSFVAWSNDFFPDHPCCRIVAKGKAVKQNPDIYEKFLKAEIEAEKVKTENQDYDVSVNKKYLKVSDELAKENTLEPHITTNIDPNKKGVVTMWKEMIQINYIKSDKDITKYINTNLYKKALDELKKENPSEKFYNTLEDRFKQQDS